MSYPPPPGINNLPARPPPSNHSSNAATSASSTGRSGFKSSFSAPAPQSSASYGPSYPGSTPSYGPSAPPSQYGASYSSYPGASSGGRGGGGMSASAQSYAYPAQPSQPPQPQSYGPQSYSQPSYGATPQIRNPFPLPGQPGAQSSDYDPEMAAQIAQWQSAYVSKDESGATTGGASETPYPKPEAPVIPLDATGKKKTVVREGGGKKWTDETLLEWDPSHLRLFVGNLAGETSDESLLKAFSRWKSVQKAKVVRDKRTTKSKGFGFVSFSDADDFFQAAKEMNGKYIQSHPVVVRKANTEIKITNAKDKDRGRNNKNKNKNKNSGNGGGAGGAGGAGGYEPQLGPMHGGGVTKPGQKTKNGLRLLG